MRLIIVRHAKTIENAAGILQGNHEGMLSEEGKQQAEALANYLKNEKVTAIYSSDKLRALDTLKPIHKHHPEAKFIVTEKLRERNHGEFQGQKINPRGRETEAEKKFADLHYVPKDGESWIQMYERASAFLKTVLKKHVGNHTVLLVTHGGVFRAITCLLMNQTAEHLFLVNVPNTAISIFEIENGVTTCLVDNSVSHLSSKSGIFK